MSALCPALFISAIASGQGKTTVTAALARYHRNQGRTVRVFKTGPDYLDPQILETASGYPVEPLDLWMAGAEYCRNQLFKAAQEADLILIEGAMGLLDGEPSSADLAVEFGIPVAVVINAKGMAQTVAAVAYGLATYRTDFSFAGIIANALGSQRHAELIEQSLPGSVRLLASLMRDESVALPERHLGLVQPEEQSDLDARLNAAADWIAETNSAQLPEPVTFAAQSAAPLESLTQGLKIGVAKDQAFSFIYAANLRLLNEMGAIVHFFSPLRDSALPEVDALWLPGGYPELYAQTLANNRPMKAAIQAFYDAGKPILAECGGMLYVQETLTDLSGNCFEMLGLIPGRGAMRGKRGCQGMQTASLPEGDIRGHAHHRSRSQDTLQPIGFARRQRHPAPGEPIFRSSGLTAGYLHLFFPSNPQAIAKLFRREATDQ